MPSASAGVVAQRARQRTLDAKTALAFGRRSVGTDPLRRRMVAEIADYVTTSQLSMASYLQFRSQSRQFGSMRDTLMRRTMHFETTGAATLAPEMLPGRAINLEKLISDLRGVSSALRLGIEEIELRCQIFDPDAFDYPCVAKAWRERLENLGQTIRTLETKAFARELSPSLAPA